MLSDFVRWMWEGRRDVDKYHFYGNMPLPGILLLKILRHENED